MQDVSRRSFVQGAGMITAAAAVAGVSTAHADEDAFWMPERWDDEADVIVCGCGGSGSIAAMTVVNEGGSCIVIEKSPYREGGDMACAGGQLHDCPGADPEEWYECYKRGAYGAAAPRQTMMPYMEEAVKIVDWVDEYGIAIDWSDFHGDGNFLPADNLIGNVAGCDGVLGVYLWQEVDKALYAHDIDVRLGTPAKRLIQDPRTKEILGVQAEGPDGEALYFKANKGVILATGGFGANNDMFQNYYQPGPEVQYCGTPYNTGDGITMALAVGADLWHLNNYPEYGAIGPVKPAQAFGGSLFGFHRPEFVYIDRSGKRFMNEGYVESHDMNHKPAFDFNCQSVFSHRANDPRALQYNEDPLSTGDFLHMPMFALFDQATFEKYNPLIDVANTPRGYLYAHHFLFPEDPLPIHWDDNDDAIAQGWIFKGDTLEELAANIRATTAGGVEIEGIDADNLKATVEQYNAYCEAGEDPDFLCNPDYLIPLGEGPYYAIEFAWQTVITQGGPRRNGYSQTLDSFGEAIPRLYTTGSLGSYNAYAYNIGELVQAWTTGRMAAKHAMGLESWDE